jgi:hypothetical protein
MEGGSFLPTILRFGAARTEEKDSRGMVLGPFHRSRPVRGAEFEKSAHSPLLEEPDLAHRILEHDVLGRATALADLR